MCPMISPGVSSCHPIYDPQSLPTSCGEASSTCYPAGSLPSGHSNPRNRSADHGPMSPHRSLLSPSSSARATGDVCDIFAPSPSETRRLVSLLEVDLKLSSILGQGEFHSPPPPTVKPHLSRSLLQICREREWAFHLLKSQSLALCLSLNRCHSLRPASTTRLFL